MHKNTVMARRPFRKSPQPPLCRRNGLVIVRRACYHLYMEKTLIFVNGTMGSGKTTVCLELASLIADSVFLDGDWCWFSDPFKVDDATKKVVIDNISHCLNNFLACGSWRVVIFCWVMDDPTIAETVLKRLDLNGVRILRFTLDIDDGELRKRLEKDIRGGSRRLSVTSDAIKRLPLYAEHPTIHIDVSELTAKGVANKILSYL